MLDRNDPGVRYVTIGNTRARTGRVFGESLGRRILEEVGEKGKSGGKVGRLTLYPYKIFITLRYFQVIGAAVQLWKLVQSSCSALAKFDPALRSIKWMTSGCRRELSRFAGLVSRINVVIVK